MEEKLDIITTEEGNYGEINKVINDVIDETKEYKNRNIDELRDNVINIIKNSKLEPDTIIDRNKETLAHLMIKINIYERVVALIQSYIELLGVNDSFFNWLLSENNKHETSLDLCVQHGNKKIIKYMYSIISKTTENKFRIAENRNGIFHHAAIHDQGYPIIFFHEKLQKFFKKIPILDVPSEKGATPLHLACSKGSRKAVNILLDLGANINAVDNDGNSCLHHAVISNNLTILKKLLIRGADKNIINKEGKSSLQLAQENNAKTATDILSANNSLIQSPCNKNYERSELRGNHNNFSLFVIILLMGFGKWIYLSRLFYVYEGSIKYDIIPFVYEIETIKSFCFYGNEKYYENCTINETLINNYYHNVGSLRSNITSIFDLFSESTFGYNFLEKSYIIAWGISCFELILLFMILKFMFFSSEIYLKKKTFKKESSLINLFDNNKNICVKCRIPMEDTTVHCVACNRCVLEFDHHCSWLNICICRQNFGTYKTFLYIFCAYIFSNFIFFFYSK